MSALSLNHLLGPVVAVLALLLIFSNRIDTGKAKETPDGLAFPVKPVYAWSRILALPGYMIFFLWLAWKQSHAVPWPIILFCLIAVAIGLFQMPGTIILSPTAVIQRFWIQPSKTIPYGEIMSLRAIHGGRTLLVVGYNRDRIRHSSNHTAPSEFRSELERRSGKFVIN